MCTTTKKLVTQIRVIFTVRLILTDKPGSHDSPSESPNISDKTFLHYHLSSLLNVSSLQSLPFLSFCSCKVQFLCLNYCRMNATFKEALPGCCNSFVKVFWQQCMQLVKQLECDDDGLGFLLGASSFFVSFLLFFSRVAEQMKLFWHKSK